MQHGCVLAEAQNANAFASWCVDIGLQRENRGNVAALLLVLERSRTDPSLLHELKEILAAIEDERTAGFAALSLFVTKGEGQIAGITGPNLEALLRSKGITGKYLGVDAGRTSRGNFRLVRMLLSYLGRAENRDTGESEFSSLLALWQDHLLNEFIIPALEPDPIVIRMQSAGSASAAVRMVLDIARERGLEGSVAQHLVGAKLARRHWSDEIFTQNFPCFSQDSALSRPADFVAGNIVYHVTVAPKSSLVTRIEANTQDGHEARVLVRSDQVASIESAFVREGLSVVVLSISSFIVQNIDEMSNDAEMSTLDVFIQIADIYNARVKAVERESTGIEIRCDS